MRNYTKIKAWQLADDFVVHIYEMTTDFPVAEKFALTSQLRRAAYSIAANVAEGAGRRTTKDFIRFLDMALGSANESSYFIHLANRLGYLDGNAFKSLKEQITSVCRCLSSYIRAIEREANSR